MRIGTSFAAFAALILAMHAHAGEIIDRVGVFQAKKAQNHDRHQQFGCADILEGKLFQLRTDGVVSPREFSVRFRTPVSNRGLAEIDPTDESFPLDKFVDALKNISKQEDPDTRLALRTAAIQRFSKRIHELRFDHHEFSNGGEIKLYAQLLYYVSQSLFDHDPDPKETLGDLLLQFEIRDERFPRFLRYVFSSAILAGLDFSEGIQIPGQKVRLLIGDWLKLRKVEKLPDRLTEKWILKKLRPYKHQFPELAILPN